MEINSYSFGKIEISGKEYTEDVIIFPDKVKANWRRKEGHELNPEDIDDILDFKPETLIVGTGASGLMTVKPETKDILEDKKIKLIIEDTKAACDKYNSIEDKSRVVVALHLTC